MPSKKVLRLHCQQQHAVEFLTSKAVLVVVVLAFVFETATLVAAQDRVTCYICNNDPNAVLTNPEGIVDLSIIGFAGETATCADVQSAGLQLLFFDTECQTLTSDPTVQTTCGCTSSAGTPAPVAVGITPTISPTFPSMPIVSPAPTIPSIPIVTPAPTFPDTLPPTNPSIPATPAPTIPIIPATLAPTVPIIPIVPTTLAPTILSFPVQTLAPTTLPTFLPLFPITSIPTTTGGTDAPSVRISMSRSQKSESSSSSTASTSSSSISSGSDQNVFVMIADIDQPTDRPTRNPITIYPTPRAYQPTKRPRTKRPIKSEAEHDAELIANHPVLGQWSNIKPVDDDKVRSTSGSGSGGGTDHQLFLDELSLAAASESVSSGSSFHEDSSCSTNSAHAVCHICRYDPTGTVTIPDSVIDLSRIGLIGQSKTCREVYYAALDCLFAPMECDTLATDIAVYNICGCKAESSSSSFSIAEDIVSSSTTTTSLAGMDSTSVESDRYQFLPTNEDTFTTSTARYSSSITGLRLVLYPIVGMITIVMSQMLLL